MPDLAMRRLNTLSAQSRQSPSSILISIMYSSPQKNASGPPVGSGGVEAGARALTLARILYSLARALRSLLFLLGKLLAGQTHQAVCQRAILTTFSAAGPLAPWTISNSTRSPAARVLKPLP